MSPNPIGASFGAPDTTRSRSGSDDGSESAGFDLALGLAITHSPSARTPQAPDGTGASNVEKAAAESEVSDTAAQGAGGTTLRALLLGLGEALREDLTHGALARATGGTLPAAPVADDSEATNADRPIPLPAIPPRTLSSTLPSPSSPDVDAPVSITGTTPSDRATKIGDDAIARTTAGLAARVAIDPVVASVAPVSAGEIQTGALAAGTAVSAHSAGVVPSSTAAAPATLDTGADSESDADDDARRMAREASPAPSPAAPSISEADAAHAIAPLSGSLAESAAIRATPVATRAESAVPRDLATAFDAAGLAPRRALDRVTLPFEGENGLEGRLRIALRGNALHATIVTPDPDSAARIEGAIGELHRALVERGFSEVRLAVQHAPAVADSERPRSDTRDQSTDSNHRRATRDEERAGSSHHQQRRRRDARGQEG